MCPLKKPPTSSFVCPYLLVSHKYFLRYSSQHPFNNPPCKVFLFFDWISSSWWNLQPCYNLTNNILIHSMHILHFLQQYIAIIRRLIFPSFSCLYWIIGILDFFWRSEKMMMMMIVGSECLRLLKYRHFW